MDAGFNGGLAVSLRGQAFLDSIQNVVIGEVKLGYVWPAKVIDVNFGHSFAVAFENK